MPSVRSTTQSRGPAVRLVLASCLTRRLGLRLRGPRWYEQRFILMISPFALYGLLFTVVVIGPLIEVPVLVGLVYVSLWLQRRMTGEA